LHLSARFRGTDPSLGAICGFSASFTASGEASLPIQRDRTFQSDQWPRCTNPSRKRFVQSPRFVVPFADRDFNSVSSQLIEAAPRDRRIRIGHRGDNAPDPRRNNRLRARTRSARRAARLEIHV
jgi:hypothetical protein